MPVEMAFDRAIAQDEGSVRNYDAYGRLHVGLANISQAAVNEYLGREIPRWQTLGLKADQRYKMLRDPVELAKAVPTFNNLPLLTRHVAVSASDHRPDDVIGSTGTDAVFEAPFLKNSLVIWAAKDIKNVEDDLKRELSCSYAYEPDMTPGVFEGKPYDGRMTNIVANHLSLVVEGRAGPLVAIGDEKPAQPLIMEKTPMPIVTLGRKGVQTHAAVVAYLMPKLAEDAKPDLKASFAGLTHANYKASRPALVAALTDKVKGLLAKDQSIDDLPNFLGAFDESDPGEEPKPKKAEDEEDDETEAEKKARMDREKAKDKKAKDRAAKDKKARDQEEEGGEEETDAEKVKRLERELKEAKAETDEDDDKAEDSITREAMDAAVTSAVKASEKRVIQRLNDAREAEKFVLPWVGTLAVAYDSAEEIYRAAAVVLQIPDAETIHASALPTLIKLTPKPGEQTRAPGTRLTMDGTRLKGSASEEASFIKQFPMAKRIRVI